MAPASTFIKHGHPHEEAESLRALARAIEAAGLGPDDIRTPRIFSVSDQQLNLEAIAQEPPTAVFWRRLGRGLAIIHRQWKGNFGFHMDNHIGATPQPNPMVPIRHITWAEYFTEFRLKHLMRLEPVRSNREAQEAFKTALPRILLTLKEVQEEPSLVHGDLWNGNVLCGPDQIPYLIDPACHHAHREVDLAMTELFGGFDDEFYVAYSEVLPMATGYESRKTIYNLYHLLNHWLLFRGNYQDQAMAALQSLAR